ncbi:unnamed protein product [Calicophoron daubneyi]|uniref:Transmembrane protein 177 n=1 Tax=Calicophoron daubneyi TaxID=300641 RepID=A0AAV2TEM0_CALDB
MNKCSTLLRRHSQKFAFVFASTGFSIAYLLQPYYEVFARWALVKTENAQEEHPSKRVPVVAAEVRQHFKLNERQDAQLDLFLTAIDQSTVVGSLNGKGYAFLGLPYFSIFSNTLEIPVDSVEFNSAYFPHGPYSRLGQQRLELMVIPESALRFLIARELVRLGAKTSSGTHLYASPRTKCLATIGGMIGGSYTAYQFAYAVNRIYRLRERTLLPSRLLLYAFISLVALFSQYQVLLAWRRHSCFAADRIAASLDESYLHGGLAYYEWRLRWNRFWYERFAEFQMNQKEIARKKQAGFDPVLEYQQEEAKVKTTNGPSSKAGRIDEYYLPTYAAAAEEMEGDNHKTNASTGQKTGRESSYSAHPRLRASGVERWAGDGDGLAFGLTESLTVGVVPSPLAWLLGLFSSPADSLLRLERLKAIAARAQTERNTV